MTVAPYSADVRAKGWRFEIDHERIRQSDTWALAPAEVRPWLLMLWMVAWEQTPCGSLPNDDKLVAARIGMPAKTFAKHRDILMRGWWLADDGRLYHDTIAARVLVMLEKRAKDARRTADKREREATTQGVTQKSRVTRGGVTGEFDTKHQIPVIPPVVPQGDQTPSIPCPYGQIVELYHQHLPSLPRAKLLPSSRQRAMRKLWGWLLSSTKGDGQRRATNADEALQWIGRYFAQAAENDFLMGRTPRSAEHANWRCDIDFLMTDKGLRHVIERTQDAA